MILSTRASITATAERVIAGAISFLFLGEVMKSLQITGAGIVIASIMMLQIRKDPGQNQ
jgi:drug/metabolite transporter (DMT)-like permease